MIPLVTMQPISILSSEMGAVPIPEDKNMHRCRQVRTGGLYKRFSQFYGILAVEGNLQQ